MHLDDSGFSHNALKRPVLPDHGLLIDLVGMIFITMPRRAEPTGRWTTYSQVFGDVCNGQFYLNAARHRQITQEPILHYICLFSLFDYRR